MLTHLTSLCVTHVLGHFVTDLLGSYHRPRTRRRTARVRQGWSADRICSQRACRLHAAVVVFEEKITELGLMLRIVGSGMNARAMMNAMPEVLNLPGRRQAQNRSRGSPHCCIPGHAPCFATERETNKYKLNA